MIRSTWSTNLLGGLGLMALAVGCSDCGGGPEPTNSEIQFVADRTSLENTFNSTFRFEVRLDASNTAQVTVDYETVEGTAKAGEDFEPQSGTLVFEPGDLIAQIEVPIVIDEGLEADEQFTVVLSNPVNGYLKGNQQVATGTILNDDTELDISLPEGGYDTPHSPSNPPEGMTLTWSDEFEGTAINLDNWTHELGAGGWGNNEFQAYTADPANSFVEDGNLFIVAMQDGAGYTSARMITRDKQEFEFGRIDIRAVLPIWSGHLARLVDARRQLHRSGLASVWRNRHHGIVGASAQLRSWHRALGRHQRWWSPQLGCGDVLGFPDDVLR